MATTTEKKAQLVSVLVTVFTNICMALPLGALQYLVSKTYVDDVWKEIGKLILDRYRSSRTGGRLLPMVSVPDQEPFNFYREVRKRLRIYWEGPLFEDRGDRWKYYLGGNGEDWNKVIPARGLSFEWMTWTPRLAHSSREIRKYFEQRGFHGNTQAFIAWTLTPDAAVYGRYATIPPDDECHVSYEGCSAKRTFAVPTYSYDCKTGKDNRAFGRHWLENDWEEGVTYVAFRVIG